MNFDLKFLDSSEFSGEVNAHFSTRTFDDCTAILTTTGVLILELHPKIERQVKEVGYFKRFIRASKYALIEHLESKIEEFLFHLGPDPIFSLLLQHNMVGHLENIKTKPPEAIKCGWSPARLVGEHNVLAVITDAGSLELYVKIFRNNGIVKYETIVNMTEKHIEKYKWKWAQVNDADLYQEALKRVALHTPKAMVWTHMMSQTLSQHNKKVVNLHYCVLIVAYADGRIVFWQFNETTTEKYAEMKPFWLGEFESDLKCISALHWHPANASNSGLLVIGSSDGRAIILPVIKLLNNYMQFDDVIQLHSNETCDLSVDYIDSFLHDHLLCILIVHHGYLFIYQMNNDGDITNCLRYDCQNLRITQFVKTKQGTILLLTLTGALKEIKLIGSSENVQLEVRDIWLNINFATHTITGLFLSRNNAIFSIITRPTGYFYKRVKPTEFTNYANQSIDALDAFLNQQYIYHGYDFIEVLRVLSLHNKELVCNRLPANVNYDDLTLSQLKKYFYIARISEAAYGYIETIAQYGVKQAADIETMINMKLAVALLREICNEIKQQRRNAECGSSSVSAFKREAAFMCMSYLRDVVMQNFLHEHNLLLHCTDAVLSVLNTCDELNLFEHIDCKLCGLQLMDKKCVANHADNRCAWTMIQITNSKYKCSVCVKYVSENMFAFLRGATISCPFCDAPLETLHGPLIEYDTFIEPAKCPADCLDSSFITIKQEMRNANFQPIAFCD